MAIYFYSVRDEYGAFSNFSPHRIFLKKHWWPTTEHYFQAQKFAGTEHEHAIRKAKTPKIAAEMGRDRSRPLRRDWESVKDNVMREAVRAKFTTHGDLRTLLLSTGDEELIEATTHDYYWGYGSDHSGKNMLGKILMEIRAELRNAQHQSD